MKKFLSFLLVFGLVGGGLLISVRKAEALTNGEKFSICANHFSIDKCEKWHPTPIAPPPGIPNDPLLLTEAHFDLLAKLSFSTPGGTMISEKVKKSSKEQTTIEGIKNVTGTSAFGVLAALRAGKAKSDDYTNFRSTLSVLGAFLMDMSKASDEDIKTFIQEEPYFPALTLGLMVYSLEKATGDDGKPVLRLKARRKGNMPRFR
ncbi:hypothetical protein A2645_00285 [Candidatus Nomurabacteria bacterium RIFCSPHIGHO2_01_FULL_39_9]|uniref:Uncharacterized protein n=1 Tax=Candidatus Nomurabacteria bacterium RIFCSPHIGHO2_01_FULL_39_9 TaxID=1801735 RepID=A0A1F6UVM1_9BACT|nr:MAG: hypothetical protein A2645_00285 [Candidatus Nomurabacteria bacterium RIFCSPHIGHO2_01_FULL_39_9]